MLTVNWITADGYPDSWTGESVAYAVDLVTELLESEAQLVWTARRGRWFRTLAVLSFCGMQLEAC